MCILVDKDQKPTTLSFPGTNNPSIKILISLRYIKSSRFIVICDLDFSSGMKLANRCILVLIKILLDQFW